MAKSIILLLIKAGILTSLLGSLANCSTIPREEQEDKWAKWDYCQQWAYDGESWMQCMNS